MSAEKLVERTASPCHPQNESRTPDLKQGRSSKRGESPKDEKSEASKSPNKSTPPPPKELQERCNCDELRHVDAILETKDLWEKFFELGTEMIITKTGR